MVETILESIGLFVVASGGLVAVAWGIFRVFGEKWLDTKFGERLAAFRHEQQKELEHLRFKINALLDRSTKLNQREFEVLPEAWSRLNEAYWQAIPFISPLQEYPDIKRMRPDELTAFLESSVLTKLEQRDLLEASDRNRYYIERAFWHRLAKVKAAARDCHVYILKNGIFFPSELRDQFGTINTMIWEAVEEHELNQEYNVVPRESAKQQALRDQGPRHLKELELLVRGRLWASSDDAP